MVNIPPLGETQKPTKGPRNSLETAINENNYENYVPSIPKNSTVQVGKIRCL